MSQKIKQHFVPQFHFRLFTRGKRFVHLASRDGQCFAYFAGVKGQCARHKFYGDERLEDWLSGRESRHAKVYRSVLDIAWNRRRTPLNANELKDLRESLLLQRMRTPRSARLNDAWTREMMLYAYGELLQNRNEVRDRDGKLQAIRERRATLRSSEQESLLIGLRVGAHAAAVISDLSLVIMRNRLREPFIMGDAPCVFGNFYMRRVTALGVLGFSSVGLMIALPIDARTQVLLYDGGVYNVQANDCGCVDILALSDVSTLNAQQIHSAERNVYFSDRESESYVKELLAAHRRLLRNEIEQFHVYHTASQGDEGIAERGTLMHVFEPMLPIPLELSFLATSGLGSIERAQRPRNMELAVGLETALRMPSRPGQVDLDDLFEWVDSRIAYVSDEEAR